MGSLVAWNAPDVAAQRVSQGFEYLELQAPHQLSNIPTTWPDVPLIWQAPPDLPADHPATVIQDAVLQAWQQHLAAAVTVGAVLLVVQFRAPDALTHKADLIQAYARLLGELTPAARQQGVQVVLRNSPANQLQLLREIMRAVPGLGLALDIAYTHFGVVKPLYNEFLWDSDLAPRLAHVYISDMDGQNPQLRLPLGALGSRGPDWVRIAKQLRARYDASITLDVGDADYLAESRQRWIVVWENAAS